MYDMQKLMYSIQNQQPEGTSAGVHVSRGCLFCVNVVEQCTYIHVQYMFSLLRLTASQIVEIGNDGNESSHGDDEIHHVEKTSQI